MAHCCCCCWLPAPARFHWPLPLCELHFDVSVEYNIVKPLHWALTARIGRGTGWRDCDERQPERNNSCSP